eukprot:TRINITY_DN9636_c0_g1_i2.p1 TRINITY_DN9636_c0_g1~~TRINITY_DN9636_c0_g1_i2.p1  ORF type:complete len:225 (+),score=53.36 TRINITY_DN9636_c0_g1_i2:75-749(+)
MADQQQGQLNVSDPMEPISTIHVSGLPADFKEREFYLLLRNEPGFKYGFLKYGEGKMTLGFAQFDTPEQAQNAAERNDGLGIDLDRNAQKIHVHVAASNMRKKPVDSIIGSNQSKLPRHVNPNIPHYNGAYPGYPPPHAMPAKQPLHPHHYPQQYHHHQHHHASSEEHRPCNTLYVSNIDPRLSFEQLHAVFSRYPDFNKLTLKSGKAWADFKNTSSATQVAWV